MTIDILSKSEVINKLMREILELNPSILACEFARYLREINL